MPQTNAIAGLRNSDQAIQKRSTVSGQRSAVSLFDSKAPLAWPTANGW
ncbi:MAG: hypothetical protein F6K65_10710 [Moorea sp. SIO3C2]|nr:hypothetical protein [Moorena sp. SIO3C2]